jgi:hypothetical protein
MSDLAFLNVPPRLAPFLAQWDYMTGVLAQRLDGLSDEEYLWEPAPGSWSVRQGEDGRVKADAEVWAPDGTAVTPPRTLAWSIGHLASGVAQRADWLTGSHSLRSADVSWYLEAHQGVEALNAALRAWRDGLTTMTDTDLDTIGRSAYPDGLDPQLPLLDIVWWVNKELLFHAGEIWLVRDLYGTK